jgi:hypothetical protein
LRAIDLNAASDHAIPPRGLDAIFPVDATLVNGSRGHGEIDRTPFVDANLAVGGPIRDDPFRPQGGVRSGPVTLARDDVHN